MRITKPTRQTAARVFLAGVIAVFLIQPVMAGWSPVTHRNFISEAIRILPYFNYLWCNYYRDNLLKGVIEGEFHFRHYAKGQIPHWLIGNVTRQDLKFVNGYDLSEKDVVSTARFMATRLENLRIEFQTANRRNSEIMFDLGYCLHSVINVIVPRSTREGMPGTEPYARNTAPIDLKQSRIDSVTHLRPWLEKRLHFHIQSRNRWETAQNTEDFKRRGLQASEGMIYSLSGIITYVLDTSFGPESENARTSLQVMKTRRLGDGRKPDIK